MNKTRGESGRTELNVPHSKSAFMRGGGVLRQSHRPREYTHNNSSDRTVAFVYSNNIYKQGLFAGFENIAKMNDRVGRSRTSVQYVESVGNYDMR